MLDEALFFPETTDHDNYTIFIYWSLHADSLPATRYVMSVGLESEGEERVTTVSIPVTDSSSPSSSSKHQFAPVTAGMLYTISVRAVNDVKRVSSPVMSVVWRVGEDICEWAANIEEEMFSLSLSLSLSPHTHTHTPPLSLHTHTHTQHTYIHPHNTHTHPHTLLSSSPHPSLYIVPTFYNLTTSLLSPTGSLSATWTVLTPGLRPLTHLTVQWVETSAVQDEGDLSDPTSSAFPTGNIEIMEYDVRNQSQVVMQDDVISLPLRGLVKDVSYYVGVTATSLLGSKTSVFQFTAGIISHV